MHRNSMASPEISKRLNQIYTALYSAWGPQHWWPGKTVFEIMTGAVLTQNTAWTNVEKAITNLRSGRVLTLAGIERITVRRLSSLIRPSGYHNVKAKRLRNLVDFIRVQYRGSLKKMFSVKSDELRKKLLEVNGIGPETADSILLYAGGKPFFVVDAYTRRILGRHGLINETAPYESVQKLFMDNLPRQSRLYNEFHALLVKAAKEHCKKSRPVCRACPLENFT